MRYLIAALCIPATVFVASCVGAPQVVSETPAQVILTESALEDGLAFAQERCQRYGRDARFAGNAPWGKHVYHCVDR